MFGAVVAHGLDPGTLDFLGMAVDAAEDPSLAGFLKFYDRAVVEDLDVLGSCFLLFDLHGLWAIAFAFFWIR